MKANIFLILFASMLACRAQAAGFLDHKDGVPFKWQFPVTYLVDQGDLGNISGAMATMWVQDAFLVWENSTAGTATFVCGGMPCAGSLGVDVIKDNVLTYVVQDTGGALRNAQAGQTIVIFDSDGSIFDFLFGTGSSSNILGFASPGAFDLANSLVTQGLALINGKIASEQRTRAVMTHEFGHMLNLSHTQLNTSEALDGDATNDSPVPTMFPILPDDPSQLLTLHRDDEFSLGFLYPSAEFTARASIDGKILRKNGAGVRAVNVVCRKTDNPKVEAVSWLSDFILQGNGEYSCGNLIEGSYSVDIEPVTLAINFFDPEPPFIASESYNGASESFDPGVDARAASEAVTLGTGQKATDINVILNEDGRLFSGKKTTNTADAFFAPLEYFITVPEGATSVKFELAAKQDVDLDLLGRCDTEFSLPIDSTASPLVSSSGGKQQAEFATEGLTGVETVELSANSSPVLKACTYHLLVVNFDPTLTPTDFDLTATVGGVKPKFFVLPGTTPVVNDGSGEIVVFSRIFSSEVDAFQFKSLLLTEKGNGDLSRVASAKLKIASDGRELAAGVVDTTTRTILFSNFSEEIIPTVPIEYIVTYTVTGVAAGWSPMFLFLLLGLGVGVWRQRKTVGLLILCILPLMLSCGNSTEDGFVPKIQNEKDITVTGQSFGTSFNLTIDDTEVKSVDDFFDKS